MHDFREIYFLSPISRAVYSQYGPRNSVSIKDDFKKISVVIYNLEKQDKRLSHTASCSRNVSIHIWTACFIYAVKFIKCLFKLHVFKLIPEVCMQSMNMIITPSCTECLRTTFWTTGLSQHQTGKQRSYPGMVQQNLAAQKTCRIISEQLTTFFLIKWRP